MAATSKGLVYPVNTDNVDIAVDIQALADSVNSNMVALAGDTMTGALTLSGDPTAALHAATKDYVDRNKGLPEPVGSTAGQSVITVPSYISHATWGSMVDMPSVSIPNMPDNAWVMITMGAWLVATTGSGNAGELRMRYMCSGARVGGTPSGRELYIHSATSAGYTHQRSFTWFEKMSSAGTLTVDTEAYWSAGANPGTLGTGTRNLNYAALYVAPLYIGA